MVFQNIFKIFKNKEPEEKLKSAYLKYRFGNIVFEKIKKSLNFICTL